MPATRRCPNSAMGIKWHARMGRTLSFFARNLEMILKDVGMSDASRFHRFLTHDKGGRMKEEEVMTSAEELFAEAA